MYSPYFTISNKILKNIGLIEGAREMIKNSPLLPLYEKKFQQEAVVKKVHHGTHIEGNPLNLTEVEKVVEGKKIVGRKRDVQEVINYRNVIKFIEEGSGKALRSPTKSAELVNRTYRANKTNRRSKLRHYTEMDITRLEEFLEIDESLIKKLHKLVTDKILPPSECGVYRKKQVVVKNSRTGKVSFRPAPAVEVPYLMEEFLSWLNGTASKEVHPILKAGIAQYELVHIHPFLDGNGRVARALATLILYQQGYDIRRFFSLEEYYDQDAERYYQALQSVKDSDLTPWLEYFSKGLAIELNRVKERVQKLSQDTALRKQLGGKQIYLSERQIEIIEFLRTAGVFRNQDFDHLFPMISDDTVLRELKDLMKKGIIEKKGKTKAARYVLRRP